MFLNILNLGAFVSMRDAIRSGSAVIELENELGRIYSVVNMPIKIVNDLFKKDREMSGSSEEKNKNINNKLFALFVPVKQTKKSDNALYLNGLAPVGSGSVLFKSFNAVLFDISAQCCRIIQYLQNNDIVRFMLLLLMIMLVLPRGIPIKIKNLININFAFPVFVFNKGGISILLWNAKGRLQ